MMVRCGTERDDVTETGPWRPRCVLCAVSSGKVAAIASVPRAAAGESGKSAHKSSRYYYTIL